MKAQGREALATSRSFCRDRMGRRDGACLPWELLPKEYGGAWLDGRIRKMKIAASDFDGTISFHEKGIPTENLDAIRAWQTAGHKFGLVTGRKKSMFPWQKC